MLSRLAINDSAVPNYTLQDGLIKYKNRVWLGSNIDLHKQIFTALHASVVGGHSGAPATYHRIKNLFYWPSMKTDILHMVQNCSVC